MFKVLIINSELIEIISNISGNSRIIKTSSNEIIINCKTTGGGLLVLSEVYYKNGWKCKIDGKDSKIYQTNHVLRSVYVPHGEHEVVFKKTFSIFSRSPSF